MKVLCLDLEGILVPEVWLQISCETGVAELALTTRDIENYDELMGMRLKLLATHGLTLSTLQRVISGMTPFEGAKDFLTWAQSRFQVAILSDTFYEFAQPLMDQLGDPFLLCHRLEVENDSVQGYRLRQEDPKAEAVKAFQSMQMEVVAVGDSYNDISMLIQADKGFLFAAPANIVKEHPSLESIDSYEVLKKRLEAYC